MAIMSSHKDTIWATRTLAAAILRPELTLKALAGMARRDNTEMTLKVSGKDLGDRAGATSAKTGRAFFDTLAAVPVDRNPKDSTRLVESVKGGNGTAFTVTFGKIPHDERLELPQAALWEHKWVAGNVTGPRYGKDTGRVAQFLLAVIAAGEWDKVNHTVVCDLPVTTKSGNGRKSISAITGMSADKFERAWATVYAVCANDPWITWELTYRANGGQGPWRFTINWDLLPAMTEPPVQTQTGFAETTKVSLVKVGTFCGPEQGTFCGPGAVVSAEPVGYFLRSHKEEDSSLVPVLENQFSSPSSATIANSDTENYTQGKAAGGKEERMSNNKETAYDRWVVALIAGITSPNKPNALPMTQQHASALKSDIQAAYSAGWHPEALAACLTQQSPDLKTLVGALRYRLKHLGAVNVIPMKKTAAQARSEAADALAYEETKRLRDAARYTQRTM